MCLAPGKIILDGAHFSEMSRCVRIESNGQRGQSLAKEAKAQGPRDLEAKVGTRVTHFMRRLASLTLIMCSHATHVVSWLALLASSSKAF